MGDSLELHRIAFGKGLVGSRQRNGILVPVIRHQPDLAGSGGDSILMDPAVDVVPAVVHPNLFR